MPGRPAPEWSARAEVARSMALLPVSDAAGRALCAARLARCAEGGEADAALRRGGVVTAAVYLSRAALRMREGRALLDALVRRAAEGGGRCAERALLREQVTRGLRRDRALQVEVACEAAASPVKRFVQVCLGGGEKAGEGEPFGGCHPDVLIRKLIHADDSGTTLRYTASEVDAVFFQANEVDTEVVHSLWSGSPAVQQKQKKKKKKEPEPGVSIDTGAANNSGADGVRLTDEDYYISLERHSIASRIADATATDLGLAQRIATQPGGLRALRHLADSAPSGDAGELFQTDIARCIANVAASATDIAATATRAVDDGLVSLLSRWTDNESIHAARGHLRVEAFRALSNLSQSLVPDASRRYRYVNGLLPLHPPFIDGLTSLAREQIDTDVVFVHGLRGGPLMTWRCGPGLGIDAFGNMMTTPDGKVEKHQVPERSQVWARDWLVQDAPNCRVLSIGHDAGVLRGGLGVGMIGPTLSKRAEDIRQALRDANVGADGRKVVLISHSYGGLLVKEVLLKDSCLMEQTRGIVFFGVPHFGSPVAGSLAGQTQVVLSQAVRELFPSADARVALERLNDDFSRALEAHASTGSRIKVVSFGEGKKLKVGASRGQAAVLLDLVPRMSADPQVGQFWLIHDADHVQLSKPTAREDFRYRVVSGMARGGRDEA